MEIKSAAFVNNGVIPVKYTCDGLDVSPPLEWSDTPTGTQSLALICEDPDAPVGIWVHWVIYDLPAREAGLKESVAPQKHLHAGIKQGTNDFRKIGYGGPCPPSGEHRYFFKLYALDRHLLSLSAGATKSQLLKAMEGHVLAEAQLVGRYRRK